MRRFEQTLGESDAACEFIELGLRHLGSSGTPDIPLDEAIDTIAKREGVCVHPSVFADARRVAVLLSIVSAFAELEAFLHEFRLEHIDLHSTDWDMRRDSEDLLSFTLRNVREIHGADEHFVPRWLKERLEYYRLLRVAFVHRNANVLGRADNLKNSMPAVPVIHGFDVSKLKAPNGFDAVTFDDFILYSRCCKHLSEYLRKVCKPSDWVAIARTVQANFHTLDSRPARQRNAVIQTIMCKYGLSRLEVESIYGALA